MTHSVKDIRQQKEQGGGVDKIWKTGLGGVVNIRGGGVELHKIGG